ncbi:MAG: hypothetical protein ACFN9G_13225, partial [Cardiobacterium sp.]
YANGAPERTVCFIAIHRKFQTRRVAEDSTRLYGEATQHSMRLSVDGYTYTLSAQVYVNPFPKKGRVLPGLCFQ